MAALHCRRQDSASRGERLAGLRCMTFVNSYGGRRGDDRKENKKPERGEQGGRKSVAEKDDPEQRRKNSRLSKPVRSGTSAHRECDPLTTVSPRTPAPLFCKYECQAPSFKKYVRKNEVPAQCPLLFVPRWAGSCPFGNSGTNTKPRCAGDRKSEVGKREVRKGSEVLPALQIPGPVGGATRHGAARGARPSSSSLRGSLGRPCADSDRAGAAAPRAPPCLPAAAGDPRAPAASVVFGLGFLFKALPKWPPRTHFAQGGNHALLFQ